MSETQSIATSSNRSADSLAAELTVWETFGYVLLALVGAAFIVPSPWTSTIFYRWLSERVVLPGGRHLGFSGKPGDIWWAFILVGLLTHASRIGDLHSHDAGNVGASVVLPIEWILNVFIIRWFVRNLTLEGDRLNLTWDGSIWGFIGWNVLLILSIFTIIGWAWIVKAMMRWIARHVRGPMEFDFVASGWEVLWRSVVFTLVCTLIIPIPWMLAWYMRWMIGRFTVSGEVGGLAAVFA